MHDAHKESGQDYTPDPDVDWVVYEFSEPTTVTEIKVRQHKNGIMRIIGESGNDETTFPHKLGSAAVDAKHDVEIPEGKEQIFKFHSVSPDHPPKDKYLRVTIAETVNRDAAWATYRLIPRDAGHQPFRPCGIDK